jgi:hypothetical protein
LKIGLILGLGVFVEQIWGRGGKVVFISWLLEAWTGNLDQLEKEVGNVEKVVNVDLKSRLDGEFYKAQGRALRLNPTINHGIHSRT